VAYNEDELCRAINDYLKDSAADLAAQRRFLAQECTYLDGSAGQRTAQFLLSIAEGRTGVH
jgi:hypothetical protein